MRFHEFMDRMLTAFPEATVEEDNEGQLVVYTNLQILYPSDNPSIPEGEELVLPFED